VSSRVSLQVWRATSRYPLISRKENNADADFIISSTYKYLHPLVESIVHYQRMAHTNPGGLHTEQKQRAFFRVLS
jgi:hypothetical protein